MMRLPTLALLAALVPVAALADDAATFAETATAAGVDPVALLARLVTDPAVTGAYAGAVAAGTAPGTLVDFARDWAIGGAPAVAAVNLACADGWTAYGDTWYGYGYYYNPVNRSYLAVPGCGGVTNWYDPAGDWSSYYDGWSYQNQ